MPCVSCKNRRFGGTYHCHHQGDRISELGTTLALFTLMMKALYSSETSVLTRATRLHNSEEGIFHSYRPETLKSYIALTGWAL
jgi:hypothetical protein